MPISDCAVHGYHSRYVKSTIYVIDKLLLLEHAKATQFNLAIIEATLRAVHIFIDVLFDVFERKVKLR